MGLPAYHLLVDAPSGVVTFLFTDIEGSTRRWETDADAMRAALAAHDGLMRRTIDTYGGYLFKHTGDGVCAAFSSADSAVAAAVAAQRALELPVRMGIATGEAEHRGDDYFGAVLNRTARLMAVGHGGQILVDGAASDLLSDVELLDFGPRYLRDITRPVLVKQVKAPGLPLDFPPLRTVETNRGNLRRPPTSLIGRESEIADVHTALRSHRLVTLVGVGGVGKTRLAVEVALRCAPEFLDGAYMVELAAVSDPTAVADAVGSTLGILQQPGMSMTDSIATTLGGQNRLLVFDNCEHVLDATAAIVAAVTAQSSTTRIMATSRESLALQEERVLPVAPLHVDSHADSPAARLFIDRAAAVAQTISPRNDAAVAEICRRLDGIPLAIELAASRLVSMTVTEMHDRLSDVFRLLAGSRRGPQRHQTLRHAVQWSYDLLDGAEKQILQRCSVFAGGFDLSAVSAVTDADDEATLLDLLDALVRKSLLIADRSGSCTRYSMLETIRQFAAEQLGATGDEAAVRDAHAQHFAMLEESVLTVWDSQRQQEAFTWLTTELANLRAAFRWAADHNNLDLSAGIAVCAGFLGGWIELHEPCMWAEELIEAAKRSRHHKLGQLYVVAAECYRTGRLTDAVGYATEAVDLIQGGGYARAFFDIEPTALGGTYITVGMVDDWLTLCHNWFANRWGLNPFNRGSMVMALVASGDIEQAHRCCADLLASADKSDNPGAAAFALLSYGYAYTQDHPRVAYEALRRGLTIAHTSGNRMIEAYLAVALSALASEGATPAETLDFVTLAINNFYNSGSYSHMVSPLGVLAAYFDRSGNFEGAATIAGFAATTFALTTFPQIKSTITHLREVLGQSAFEALTHDGAHMSHASIAQYALDQIEQARALLS